MSDGAGLVVGRRDPDLEGLELLGGRELDVLAARYAGGASGVAEGARRRIGMAAALVETALDLQRVGGPAAAPGELLIGDLCLARASRILAEAGTQPLQVGFARVVEQVSAAAAAGRRAPSVRGLLESVLRAGS